MSREVIVAHSATGPDFSALPPAQRPRANDLVEVLEAWGPDSPDPAKRNMARVRITDPNSPEERDRRGNVAARGLRQLRQLARTAADPEVKALAEALHRILARAEP